MERLRKLLSQRKTDLQSWIIGKIPSHYKRLNIPMSRAKKLAELGATKTFMYFGDKLFFTQALITGAIYSGEFDNITICSPAQYGKSWVLARAGIGRAYEGNPTYVAGSTESLTEIIMAKAVDALQDSAPEIQNELLNKKDQIERLVTSISKTKLAFSAGGFLEGISLGGSYQEISRNKALGRAGDYFVDEAALIPESTFAEMGRREFARLGGEKYLQVLISNPHNPGVFYNKLTEAEPDDRTLIIWMDALTAVEEERFTEKQVLNSDFAKRKSERTRYLLCELDADGQSMFEKPKVVDTPNPSPYKQYYMGIDAAYKGHDELDVALTSIDEMHVETELITTIDKANWIDGKTSDDICDKLARMARAFRVAMISVDSGWGVWIIEGLVKRGLPVKGVNFNQKPDVTRAKKHHYASANASNKRAEMHLDLQDLIEKGNYFIVRDAYDQIKEILPLVDCKRKTNGKIEIRPKPEIKALLGHSPDALDSVLLSINSIYETIGLPDYMP